jgi:hypothetical protein
MGHRNIALQASTIDSDEDVLRWRPRHTFSFPWRTVVPQVCGEAKAAKHKVNLNGQREDGGVLP